MDMKELPKKYDHKAAEARWQQHWVEEGTYHYQGDLPREETFVIDTPPPTVSGQLHMGHIFSYTQCDFVARYQRMSGKDVFYPMGFDDNGLPTERLVEKSLKKRAVDYDSREAFIEACTKVSEEARQEFRNLFQSTALSVDWRKEYHTISESSRALSQESFIDLYEKEHVSRRQEPMLWDPVDQTAIAQAEIEDKELPSAMHQIEFRVQSSEFSEDKERGQQTEPAESVAPATVPLSEQQASEGNKIIISTTRPELIPACVGIFYHPDDERYQHLKGKKAITPLFDVKVDILPDDTVEPDKGTGIMMCCTFGDEADIEKWRKHNLPLRIVLNKFGKLDFAPCNWLTANAATEALQNKKTSNADKKHPGARQIIVELLEEAGALVKSEPITHAVKCAERSGAPLEILPTPQWFVSVLDKQEELLKRSKECTWYPEWMQTRMQQWIEGLSWDWCISRQRYYGVPFPVWYFSKQRDSGAWGAPDPVYLPSIADLPVHPMSQTIPADFVKTGEGDFLFDGKMRCFAKAKRDVPQYNIVKDETVLFSPDTDVMDTWATSSISPQINAGSLCAFPNGNNEGGQQADHSREHGASHRSMQNAGGILREQNKLFPADLRPQAHEIIRTWAFYTIVKSHLHSNCAPWKDLMISGWCLAEDKTKMSKSKGNVVTPVALIEEQGADAVRYWAATSRLGTDTAFSTDLLKIGKKLVTKLFNATKFAAIHLEKYQGDAPVTEALDQWMIGRLNHAVTQATQAFEKYEYAKALEITNDLFWNDFCDNYLELIKARAYDEAGENPQGQMSAVQVLYQALQVILKLYAPFVPHVTEELYAHIYPQLYTDAESLHARGQWPDASGFATDERSAAAGEVAVQLLGAIRKAKSERGVSIKYPVDLVMVAKPDELHPDMIESVKADVLAAGSVAELIISDEVPEASIPSEDGRFHISCRFAQESAA